MERRLAVVAARATRVVRGLWPDRNPLRRTLDRAEGVVVGGLTVAFLAGAPLVAVTAGQAAYGIGARTAHAQQAAWHRVPAVLLADAPTFSYPVDQPIVRGKWTAPDGARRTGMVPAPPGASAGGTVPVWVDAAGRLTGPPLEPLQVRGQAVLAAILAPLSLVKCCCPPGRWPTTCWVGGGWPPGSPIGGQSAHSGPGSAEIPVTRQRPGGRS